MTAEQRIQLESLAEYYERLATAEIAAGHKAAAEAWTQRAETLHAALADSEALDSMTRERDVLQVMHLSKTVNGTWTVALPAVREDNAATSRTRFCHDEASAIAAYRKAAGLEGS